MVEPHKINYYNKTRTDYPRLPTSRNGINNLPPQIFTTTTLDICISPFDSVLLFILEPRQAQVEPNHLDVTWNKRERESETERNPQAGRGKVSRPKVDT